jgi:hypothetical protein
MADHALAAADAPRNDTPHLNTEPDSIRDTAASWDKLMADYLAAKTEEDAYDAEVWRPAYNRQEAFEASHPGMDRAILKASYPDKFVTDDVDKEIERLGDVRYGLHAALMKDHRAPDARALKWKLDHLLSEDEDGNNWSETYTAQTKADMARLLIAEDMARLTAPNPDAAIIADFARWQLAHAERLELPDGADEKDVWAVIDEADTRIQRTPAKTSQGIACKLWLAFVHIATDAQQEAAAIRGNLDWLEAQGGAVDWNLRLIVSALRDLAGEA